MSDDRENDPKWKAARYATYIRDNFTCQLCTIKNHINKLNCHHIKRWADFPELRYVQNNLITLCEDCHENVTGKEDQYEAQFNKIVAEKRLQSPKVQARVGSQTLQNRMKALNKWRPHNPNIRL